MSHCGQVQEIQQYLVRQQHYAGQSDVLPSAALGLVVVIPCYDEPRVTNTLEALWACRSAPCDVEVIIVINASIDDDPLVRGRNEQVFAKIQGWVRARERAAQRRGLTFHPICCNQLPSRRAGVGLARKIGMDAAVERFHRIGQANGVVVSLDADCDCDPTYLHQIANHFGAQRDTPGCSIYFEHPLEKASGARGRRAIVNYELFLRYYKQGLTRAGSPYAYYTLGSCMAVRCGAYVRHGGMNLRRAAEDFYFLQPLMRTGRFTELNTTRVLPSPRVSQRVPFGTGRAVAEQLNKRSPYLTYSPLVFRDLGVLFTALVELFARAPTSAWLQRLPAPMTAFLRTQGFAEQAAIMLGNAASPMTFLKRFHHWFDGLRTVRYARWATTVHYGWLPIEYAAAALLPANGAWCKERPAWPDAESLLHEYRRLDRTPQVHNPSG